MDAIDESLRIGAALNVPVVISHHKLVGKRNHGLSVQTLARISDAARAQSRYAWTAIPTMPLPPSCARNG